MLYIQQFANLNGVYETKDTWWQAICENEGIAEPVNGSWVQALCEAKGFDNVSNGTWVQALVEGLGITQRGTWLQSLAEEGSFVGVTFRDRVISDGGVVESFSCFCNTLKNIL